MSEDRSSDKNRKEINLNKLRKYVVQRKHLKENMTFDRTTSDSESDAEYSEESSIVESSSCSDSDSHDNDTTTNVHTSKLGRHSNASNTDLPELIKSVLNIRNTSSDKPVVDNVSVVNSTHVHIGDITNINGNIQIIRTVNGAQSHCSKSCGQRRSINKKSKKTDPQSSQMHDETQQNTFQKITKFKIPKNVCAIIPRHTWLAQLPMEEPAYIDRPVPYVIISHTATESSDIQAINIRTVRDIQCFHIESRGWNDIAYNFLIGCDGNVYEGRGWHAVGAHTLGYNNNAIGIAFIGCFMRDPPTTVALNACKSLLAMGVYAGHLKTDYKLYGHCQCRSTQSPGKKLYDVIQTWEHFSEPTDTD